MNIPLLIFSLSSGVFFFILFLIFGRLSYGNNEKRYDILTDFPYEQYIKKNVFSYLSLGSFCAFELAFILIPIAFFNVSSLKYMVSMFSFLLGACAVKVLLYNSLLLVSPSKEKPHFLLALSSFLTSSLVAFFGGLLFFQLRVDYPVLSYVVCIFLWVMTLGFVLLAINPKLMNWAKLKVVEEEAGAHLEKPRPFVLAFSEWSAILLEAILFLTLCIAFLVLCLVL